MPYLCGFAGFELFVKFSILRIVDDMAAGYPRTDPKKGRAKHRGRDSIPFRRPDILRRSGGYLEQSARRGLVRKIRPRTKRALVYISINLTTERGM